MLLTVGQIVRPHGLRGEVLVHVRTDEPEARFAVGATLLTEEPVRRGGPAGAREADRRSPARTGPDVSPAAAQAGSGGGPAVASGDAAPAVASGDAGVAVASGVGGPVAVSGDGGGVRWRVPPTLTIEAVRSHQGRLIVVFDGVYDRDVAEELRGVLLCVDSDQLEAPQDPDEFHDHQLVGLRVVTSAGEPVGEVARIEHAPASDLLVLRRPDGGSALVPFVKAIVPEVDLAGGRVVVDPPGGLFDL